MAKTLLRDNPELRPFVLSNVRLTGTRIGAGAYASVEEVAIPVDAAAKKIHEVFLDLADEKAATESSSSECASCKARDCRRSSWSDC